MQEAIQFREKGESKSKRNYQAQATSKSQRDQNLTYCAGCEAWNQKAQDLIWRYE